jgi:hypothetical protein
MFFVSRVGESHLRGFRKEIEARSHIFVCPAGQGKNGERRPARNLRQQIYL